MALNMSKNTYNTTYDRVWEQDLDILGTSLNNLRPVTGSYIVIVKAHVTQFEVYSELQDRT